MTRKASPSFDILCRAMRIWNFELEVGGVKLAPPPVPPTQGRPVPEQLPLPLSSPLESSEASVKIMPTPDGRLQVTVWFKPAASF
jgi:hypothetical protein